MKESFKSGEKISSRMASKSVLLLIGAALFVFGLAQFSSVTSNPVLVQNLTEQGYVGYNLYWAPPFVSAYVLAIVGLLLLWRSG